MEDLTRSGTHSQTSENTAAPGTRRRIRQARLRVAATAMELAAERGWDAVTVADIVSASGVARRTFFRYFPRKEDVLEPLTDWAIEAYQDAFLATTAETDLAARAGRAHTCSLAGFPGGHEAALTMFTVLLGTPELTSAWLYAQVKAENLLAAALPPQKNETSRELLAAMIVTCQRFALAAWVKEQGRHDVGLHTERLIRQALKLGQ